jgi:hypothetical protein
MLQQRCVIDALSDNANPHRIKGNVKRYGLNTQ